MTYYYTSPEHVRKFLGKSSSFSGSTYPSTETVENMIRKAEREIERRTGRAWRKIKENEEYLTADRTTIAGTPYITVSKKPILSLVSLNVWNGSEYEDFVSEKTEGRAEDYWVIPGDGKIISEYFNEYEDGIKISYYYGAPEASLDGEHAADTITLTVDDTNNFPEDGIIQIETEKIHYTGRTTTTFTGCTRGIDDTTAAVHANASTVTPVFPEVEELATKIVIYDLLYSDDRVAVYPEGNTQIPPDLKRQQLWKDIQQRIYRLQDPGVT